MAPRAAGLARRARWYRRRYDPVITCGLNRSRATRAQMERINVACACHRIDHLLKVVHDEPGDTRLDQFRRGNPAEMTQPARR
jgi:hypothetical protein